MVEFLLRRGFDLEAKDNVRFLLNCIAYFIIYIFLVTGLLVLTAQYILQDRRVLKLARLVWLRMLHDMAHTTELESKLQLLKSSCWLNIFKILHMFTNALKSNTCSSEHMQSSHTTQETELA
jgi:hypothetical protein